MSKADIIRRFMDNPFLAHLSLFPRRHFRPSAAFHQDLCNLYWSDRPRAVALLFRGSAKSTFVEETALLKALFRMFSYAVIVCSTERHSRDRLLSIKNELNTNEDIEWLFGHPQGEIWQADRIVLSNGVCIDAVSAGQNTRGMKYLSARPQHAFIDDLEENRPPHDNVSTPEKRDELRRWFRSSFLPALARPNPILRISGTMLHEDSLIGRYAKLQDWDSLTVPVEHIDNAGQRASSWPDFFPLEWIDKERQRYGDDGMLESFEQEYMCRAAAPETRAFRESMFRFEARIRTWEPVYIIYDPARTVGPQSCATGKIVASWLGGRLLVWEATQAFWQPDELIHDMFSADDRWRPIEIGVEVTGLNQFVEQPLRIEQAKKGHRLPLRALNPPRGPGKENFLLRLQPLFSAGEVIFCGERQPFQKLINELLGFPYGLKDTINALAYMLEIKPGEPVFPRFGTSHVVDLFHVADSFHTVDSFQPSRGARPYLLLHSDGLWSCAILIETVGEGLRIVADWCEEGGLAEVVPSSIRAARARAGRSLIAYAPKSHFKQYDQIGLRPAADSVGQAIVQGGDETLGQAEIRRMLKEVLGETPLFQVSREASWTLRAMSGGYARAPNDPNAMPGPYRIIGEAIECFAAVLAALHDSGDRVHYAIAKDGRRYLSSLPAGR